jgi:cytochrome c2
MPVSARAAAAPPPVACLDCHAAHYVWLGACVDCHRGDPNATRPDLAHHRLLSGAAAAWALPGSPVLPRGQALRDSLGCRRCHVSGGRGERLAIELDSVAWPRSQAELRQALVTPATSMPRFGLTPAHADTLIAALVRDADRHSGRRQYQVRFLAGSDDSLRVFARLCGACHQALTSDGPQGAGVAGANLSGLLGPHYPVGLDGPWDPKRLERWLQNPRALRGGTGMIPVAVKPDEFEAIRKSLTPAPPPLPAGR